VDLQAFTPVPALIGGLLIGLATGLALLLNGKVAGISGVFGRIFRPAPGEVVWRVWFVVGLVAGGAVTFALHAPAASFAPPGSVGVMALAGLLVGFGTRTGGGCTSGHGICGIARAAPAGIAGTVTFMVVGVATVYVVRHVLGELGG